MIKKLLLVLMLMAPAIWGQNVVISDFKGLFTNADLEDINPENATILQNLEPNNGRLVKTFAMGKRYNGALSVTGYTPYGLFTWINDSLRADTLGGGGAGRAYMGYIINDTTNVVRLYFYNRSLAGWYTSTSILANTLPTVYHNAGYNPIIHYGGIVRALPGNAGMVAGHEAEGLWIGYIHRSYFDSLYNPEAGFYAYTSNLEKTDLRNDYNIDIINHNGLALTADTLVYGVTEYFDGIQGNLISAKEVYVREAKKYAEIVVKIDTSDFNKRKTSMNIYRGDASIGDMEKIAEIDYLSKRDSANTGTMMRNGKHFAYIPGLHDYRFFDTTLTVVGVTGSSIRKVLGDFTDIFVNKKIYGITRKGGVYLITNCDSSNTVGDTTFIYDNGAVTSLDSLIEECDDYYIQIYNPHFQGNYGIKTPTTLKDSVFEATGAFTSKFNYGWRLSANYKSAVSGIINWGIYGNTGFYSGKDVGILDKIISQNLTNSVITYSDTGIIDSNSSVIMTGIITQNSGMAVKIQLDSVGINDTLENWRIYNHEYGMYYFKDTSGFIEIHYFDDGSSLGDSLPLAGEVSIKVNGKFSQMISGRHFKYNVTLDPGGRNEIHTDWLAYSELGQPDVMPVSNVIPVPDREGGPGTGLAEMFGNVVCMKKFALNILNIKTYPDEPLKWRFLQSVHNIGNIAPRGYLSIQGNLFVIAVDGIYRLTPNNLAESDMTPTANLRITDPIQDIYDTLTYAQKEEIISEYDQYHNEALFYMNGNIYAFNIENGQWREINTGITPSIFLLDEQAYPMALNSTNKKIYSTSVQDTVGISWRSKTFSLDKENDLMFKRAFITYKADSCSLNVITYIDNAATAVDTVILPNSATITTDNVYLGSRGKKCSIKIESRENSAVDDIEIHKIELTR